MRVPSARLQRSFTWPGRRHCDLLPTLRAVGQDRSKELGIRARAFHKFFTVWRHFMLADTKLTYVRDDVIKPAWRTPEKELADASIWSAGDIIRVMRYRAFGKIVEYPVPIHVLLVTHCISVRWPCGDRSLY